MIYSVAMDNNEKLAERQHIVLISCVSQKLAQCSKAEELYTSPLFTMNLAYAKQLKPDAIFILSAKYGLVYLEQEIEPYDVTLNAMKAKDIQSWAHRVLEQLAQVSTLDTTRYTFLAGEKYRKYLLPHLQNYTIPLEGLRIGEQLQKLKILTTTPPNVCARAHQWLRQFTRHSFPFDEAAIPQNGIYVLFEKGEVGHEGERIVRIGTHTGDNQLRSRLKQHFLTEKKDRSIFRKNIGRALLNKRGDSFLAHWELDLTTRKNKDAYAHLIDFEYQQSVEHEVSTYIHENFSFVVFEVEDKENRLAIESKLISTVSWCDACTASKAWLGNYSPKEKICKSGLWLVNELYKQEFHHDELDALISSY